MVIVVAIIVQPIDVFDRLLEGAVDAPHEFTLIDANHGQDVIDVRDRRLANADPRHVRRLDQADLGELASIAIEGCIQVRCRQPAGGSTANDQYFSGSHAIISILS